MRSGLINLHYPLAASAVQSTGREELEAVHVTWADALGTQLFRIAGRDFPATSGLLYGASLLDLLRQLAG